MSVIQRLRDENEQLKLEKSEMEKDMGFIANTVKNQWNELGFDFSDMSKKEGEKLSFAEIGKISLTVGKKLLSGKVKIQDIVDKWEMLTPIMNKYDHLMDQPKKLD
ncbi:hypothetical protein [Brumimicrobium mesophilum]|uniref:hypothetical protein n=1 Tax=Brumimicrobium mesophilum TaxID=392717 RepID=UPI000D1424D9|nr:hypothetical protein [Brumimicrobium mesophilum]